MLAKPPNRKRAVEYLRASGAVPIAIIERDGACSIHAGSKSPNLGDIISTVWLAEQDAARVAKEARRLAGDSSDAPTATAALARSAASLGATLTPDDVAIARADDAAQRLDSMIEQMRRGGQLHEFNREYKARRSAALAQGRGFMGYGIATARLRHALIPRLIGQSAAPMQGIFDQVFR
jgi:hypothetical protein